jgi:hypothetical protein
MCFVYAGAFMLCLVISAIFKQKRSRDYETPAFGLLNVPVLENGRERSAVDILQLNVIIVVRNYSVFGLFPSSGILKTREHNVSEMELFPSLCEGGGSTLLSWVP